VTSDGRRPARPLRRSTIVRDRICRRRREGAVSGRLLRAGAAAPGRPTRPASATDRAALPTTDRHSHAVALTRSGVRPRRTVAGQTSSRSVDPREGGALSDCDRSSPIDYA